MIRTTNIDDERTSLIQTKDSLYVNNDHKNDESIQIDKPFLFVDIIGNKCKIDRKPSPLEWSQSSWTRWIHLFCWKWLNPILSLGYKQTLTDDDLDDLPHNDKCSVLLNKLLIYDWSATTTLHIILRAYGKETFYVGLIFFPYITVRVARPLLMLAITNQFNNENNNPFKVQFAVIFAIILFLCSMAQTILYQQLLFRSAQLGMRIRNGLSSIIYQHLLSINIASLQQTTVAQTVNLISNDASRFEHLWIYIHYLWAGPLEGILAFGVLCRIIGVLPTLFGFTILFLLVPIQLQFSRWFSRYREATIICSDQRINAFNELLHGCHIIKMYNWEKPIKNHVNKIREKELSFIKRASCLRAINMSLSFVSPSLIALATFGGAWFLGFELKTADVFASIALFSRIRMPLVHIMPQVIDRLSAALVASKRIDTFMQLKTKQTKQQQSRTLCSEDNNIKPGTIILYDASFAWTDNTNTCLSSLNLTIKPGQLVGILGPVGSGKSSLLAAILDEMNLTSGNMQVNGSVSYAAQHSWIFAATIRANILLGQKFNEERYTRILCACCLDVDLRALGEAGDLTIIGEKGINLSGGQKARVSLARALYVDADIYLLDDPLSAVDSIVAKRIFDACIGPGGLLNGKTRLLVTHQTHFLSSSDHCIQIANGRIEAQGLFDQLLIKHEHVYQMNNDTDKTIDADNTQSITEEGLDLRQAVVDTKSILRDEISISGRVSWSVWRRLFTAPPLGWFGFCLLIVFLLLGEILNDASNCWLAYWSHKPYTIQQRVHRLAYIYFALVLSAFIVAIVRAIYWFYVMLCGSAHLHRCMLKGILNTSMRFFESNPSGRIINRASRDQQIIDELLPVTMFDAVQELLVVLGSIIIIGFIIPSVLLLFIPLVPIFWYYCHYYLRSGRQLKRLESVTRSPVYTLFSSSFDGLTSIRAFKVKKQFIQTFINYIDANTRAYLTMVSGSYWLVFRLDFFATLFTFVTSVVLIIMHNQVNSSLMALILMYCLNLILRYQWGLQQLVEAENYMTSAERIDEYAHLIPEEDNGGNKQLIQTPLDWPTRGSIEFRNYTLRYRSELEPVIHNINLRIEPGEKIGIIGRTGAGKSSLFQSLFRFIDRSCVDGEILIDDIDISRITLNHLRSQFTVIPQIPFLFCGTLRYNLDPFEIYTDEQCYAALEAAQLKHRVQSDPAGLYMSVAESGSNFSVGERQLICIARALLKKSKILLIDEATANVDRETDALIQAIVIDKFRDRTVLTIAHRFITVAANDRILVMEQGRVANFDIAKNILQ